MTIEELLTNLGSSPLLEQLRSLDCCTKMLSSEGVVHQGHCPVAMLEVLLQMIELAVKEQVADAARAHEEVGRHASFLLKLWDLSCKQALHLDRGALVHELLEHVIVIHNGFPTVDFSRLP